MALLQTIIGKKTPQCTVKLTARGKDLQNSTDMDSDAAL